MRAVEKAAAPRPPAAASRSANKSPLLIDTHNDVTSATPHGDSTLAKIIPKRHITDIAPPSLRWSRRAILRRRTSPPLYVKGNHSANRALQMIDTVRHDIVGRYPNDFDSSALPPESRAHHEQGKIAALMGSRAATPSRTACGCCATTIAWASAT